MNLGSNILKILSLHERLAYNLVGKIRMILIPFTNLFLKYQEKVVRKRIISETENFAYAGKRSLNRTR